MTQDELLRQVLDFGLADAGFFRTPEEDLEDAGGLAWGISLVMKLSDGVVDEIASAPTHTYFHHYRTVNAFLDQCLLRAGLLLEQAGYRYIPVAASQSINLEGWSYRGRYSHKKGACLAGLGAQGRSSLFLHRWFGPRVRLATLFTDFPLEPRLPPALARHPDCRNCGACAAACPSGAILAGIWSPGMPREQLFDPAACSRYMKEHFHHIGRGAVCGVCMRVCPLGDRR